MAGDVWSKFGPPAAQGEGRRAPSGLRRAMPRAERVGEGAGDVALVSPSTIGSVNRMRLLQALYDNGPTSRADLARLAGVNRTTVTGIVQPLIAEKLLVEGDALPAAMQGGKPARPLYFNPAAPKLAAVLILPGTVQTGLVTLTGEISAHRHASFDPYGDPDAVAGVILETLRASLAETRQPPFGIGVAAGGMIDCDKGVIVAVNLAPVLSGMPLARILQDGCDLPVVIDHHPRALLVGDRWFGPGRGLQNFAVIYTGHVLGGALYLDGHVFRGLAGSGGELGHTVVRLDGELCNCGKRGCWEAIATLAWLRARAEELGLPNAASSTTESLLRIADAGSAVAAGLLDDYARNVAVGIANLQQTMSPNFYVLHGDVASGGERMAEIIRRHVESFVAMRPNQEITLVVNGTGNGETALRGAAGLVLSDLLMHEI